MLLQLTAVIRVTLVGSCYARTCAPLLVGGSDICLPPINPTLLLKIFDSGGGGGGGGAVGN